MTAKTILSPEAVTGAPPVRSSAWLDAIVCGDCLEEMPKMPAQSVDAIITDPPFGTGIREWDKDQPDEVWAEMRRVSRGPIAIIAYGANHLKWARHFDGMKCLGYVVWNKYNQPVVSPGLTRVHQDVVIWGSNLKQLHPDRVREPYSDNDLTKRSQKYVDADYTGTMPGLAGKRGRHPDGQRCTDLWRIPAECHGFEAQNREHPNQKPLDLMRRLVLLLTNEGDTILDPFAGSGTTLLAAKQTGRHYIGIEKEQRYADTTKTRLAQEMCLGV